MAEDINDDLLEKGVLLVSDLSNHYTLPVEFMHQVSLLIERNKIQTRFCDFNIRFPNFANHITNITLKRS